jgi:hypothetical protein
MADIEVINPGDLIRQNSQAVADSLETAMHSSHEIRRTLNSLGSRNVA